MKLRPAPATSKERPLKTIVIGSLSRSLRVSLPLILSTLLLGLTACGGGNSSNGTGGGNGSGGTGGSGGSTPTTLALTPASLSLTAGAAGQQTSLLLTAPAGTPATTVSATGLPTGVTITPASISATPGTAVSLMLTAASSAAAGNATITFGATVSGQTAATQATLSLAFRPRLSI